MSHIDARVGERTVSAQVDVEYELPVQAVTETIVNAVVHRDYLSTGSVQVMLFKDRLEVWNPGRLPKGMTVEKLNGEHASLPVNPLLANPVYLAGYIEQVGTGTGTNDVIDRCVQLGLRKPEFRQDVQLTSNPGRMAANRLYQALGFERYKTNCYKMEER
jgi:predicted HTH transcriptional regulator